MLRAKKLHENRHLAPQAVVTHVPSVSFMHSMPCLFKKKKSHPVLTPNSYLYVVCVTPETYHNNITEKYVSGKRNDHLEVSAWQAFRWLIVGREGGKALSPCESLILFIARGKDSHIAPAHRPDWFPQHFLGNCHHPRSMSKLSHASKYIVIDSICNSSRDLAPGCSSDGCRKQ